MEARIFVHTSVDTARIMFDTHFFFLCDTIWRCRLFYLFISLVFCNSIFYLIEIIYSQLLKEQEKKNNFNLSMIIFAVFHYQVTFKHFSNDAFKYIAEQ